MFRDFGVPTATEGDFYFISFGTGDAESVKIYVNSLYKTGLPVWYDNGILLGDSWKKTLEDKIHDCEAVIMFLSNGVLANPDTYVRWEWYKAVEYGKKIYPIILDEVDENSVHEKNRAWWQTVCDIEFVPITKYGLESCVSKILEVVGFNDKNRYIIESGVLLKYKGSDPTVKIPYGITRIADEAFRGCEIITEIIITNGVTSIGDYAFAECTSLERVVIGDGVSEVGCGAFDGCESLLEVNFGKKLTSISSYMFARCKSLVHLDIPSGVTSIGEAAFSFCTSLVEISLPDNLTAICSNAFIYCASLKKINVSQDNQHFKSINGSLYSKDARILYCYATGNKDEIFSIPRGVTTIGEDAFGCSPSILCVIIPDSVTTISQRAFFNCCSLATVILSKNITRIAQATFSCCTSLCEITIPRGVTIIGESAFSTCYSLTRIVIPNGVTSIGADAFLYCDAVGEIVIPKSVTSIGNFAFRGCNNLKVVRFGGTKEEFDRINNEMLYIPSDCEIIYNARLKH